MEQGGDNNNHGDDHHHEDSILRKRQVELVGAIIVFTQALTHYFSSAQSSKYISQDLQLIRQDQEKYFVKKEEIQNVSNNIDILKKEIISINHGIKVIKDLSKKLNLKELDQQPEIQEHNKFSKFKKISSEETAQPKDSQWPL